MVELSQKDIELQQKAPDLVPLVQKLDPILEAHGLGEHVARVGLVLDISASMTSLYRTGAMQALVERVVALGHRFDDNGAIDVFSFGRDAHNIGEVSTGDFAGFVDRMLNKHGLEGSTMYGKALAEVRDHYFGGHGKRTAPYSDDQPPVYLIFVTDGDTHDQEECIRQVQAASFEPMFIQFISIGADFVPGTMVETQVKTGGFFSRKTGPQMVEAECPREFRFLNDLDEKVTGRFADNAGFFSIESPTAIADEDLFDRMMGEYPDWLKLQEVRTMLTAA